MCLNEAAAARALAHALPRYPWRLKAGERFLRLPFPFAYAELKILIRSHVVARAVGRASQWMLQMIPYTIEERAVFQVMCPLLRLCGG